MHSGMSSGTNINASHTVRNSDQSIGSSNGALQLQADTLTLALSTQQTNNINQVSNNSFPYLSAHAKTGMLDEGGACTRERMLHCDVLIAIDVKGLVKAATQT